MVLEGMTIDQKPLKDHLEAVGHKDAFYRDGNPDKMTELISEYVDKRLDEYLKVLG